MERKHSLCGGVSYNYSYGYGGSLGETTELQYFQEQALQKSLQQQEFGSYLGQSSYYVDQSYSQSYLHRFGKAGGALTRVFSAVAEEDDPATQKQQKLELQKSQACYQRNSEAALLNWGIVVDVLSSPQALNLSSTASSIDKLLKQGDKVIQGLHKLAAQGDGTGIMYKMKQDGMDAALNELDENGCSPLMYAALADSRPAIEMLLNFSARREQTDQEGRTAVHYAAFFGKHRSLKFLIDTASDWTPCDRHGRTPLHWSCANRSTACLEVLLKHAQLVLGDINPQDQEGMTLLHCAAHFCQPRHIALLHKAQCDCTLLDGENRTALHWTASNPDSSCIEILVELYPSLLNKQDAYGRTVLHYVAQKGAIHLATALLGIPGIDIDVKDNLERTALHWACAEGHSEVVKFLLRSNALDACIDSYGLTALHYSVKVNSTSSIQAFVTMSELTHLPNNQGLTPLMEAAAGNTPEAVQLMLMNRSILRDIDCTNPEHLTSLHLACFCGSNKSVQALLSKGANPDLSDTTAKQTPVFFAAQNGHGHCIQSLISSGAEIDLYDGDLQTPLHKAVLCSQIEAVRVLAMNGAELNMRDDSGNTALHMAAYSGNHGLLEVLVKFGANPNIQNNSGVCPLHLTAMEGFTECTKILLAHKAYVNFIDFSDARYTPVDYAQLRKHSDCVKLLSATGGVGTEEIKNMATLTIQTAYRGHRARLRCRELSRRNQAATVISKHVRDFLHVRRCVATRRRLYAAIKIQAYMRGYLQRVKFKIQLALFREEKQKWSMIENFSKLVQKGYKVHRNFEPACDLSPEGVVVTTQVEEEHVIERRLRFEASMQMRAIYQEKQKQCQAFREAEKQRRFDSANKAEICQLHGIVANSRARGKYGLSKYRHSRMVRLYCQAAVTIQRAYRRMRQLRHDKSTEMQTLEALGERREKAVKIIQKAWKSYSQWKMREAMNFVSIMTGPVLDIGRRLEQVPVHLHSYQRGIAITGSPKRKIHQTMPSEYRVLFPKTQDLLLGSKLFSSKKKSGVIRKKAKNSPHRRLVSSLLHEQEKREKKGKMVAPKKESVILPKLVTNPVGQGNINNSKIQKPLHLPQI